MNAAILTHKHLRLLLGTYLISTILTGCGGSNSTDKVVPGKVVPDKVAPSVLVSPVNGANGISAGAILTASFNEDMFASTIDSNSFTLSNGNSVDGSVTFDALTNVATFEPSVNLKMLTSYNANLTGVITDLSGNALSPMSWSFTTADGTWGTEELVESASSDAYAPDIAIDPSGNAFAVWSQTDGTRRNIWASTYSAVNNSWGSAALIDSEDLGDANNPKVVVAANGNAMAVWRQNDGTRDNIWASFYNATNTSWGSATLIENQNAASASKQEVAMDANGNAMVIWLMGADVWVNYYNGSWSGEVTIDNDSQYTVSPSVAFDGSGNAVAVWQQYHNPAPYRNNIWANRYTAGVGWATAQLLENDDVYDGDNPQVAVEPSGNAIAVWKNYDATNNYVQASRYDVATDSWGAPKIIGTVVKGTYATIGSPKIAIDTAGNAMVVWQQNIDDAAAKSDVASNRYNTGTGWGSVTILNSSNVYDIYQPDIVVDSNGNALALWRQDNSDYMTDIWVDRYSADSWGTAATIENITNPLLYAGSQQIAINSNGQAMVVWKVNNDVTGTDAHIWANRFE